MHCRTVPPACAHREVVEVLLSPVTRTSGRSMPLRAERNAAEGTRALPFSLGNPLKCMSQWHVKIVDMEVRESFQSAVKGNMLNDRS